MKTYTDLLREEHLKFEKGQQWVRVAVFLVLWPLLNYQVWSGQIQTSWPAINSLFLVYALVWLVIQWDRRRREYRALRVYLGSLFDATIISVAVFSSGGSESFLFLVYYLIIFAARMRFNTTAMVVAMAGGTLGYAMAVLAFASAHSTEVRALDLVLKLVSFWIFPLYIHAIKRKFETTRERVVSFTNRVQEMERKGLDDRIELRTGDEIEILADAFNRLAQGVRAHRESIVALNRSLEEKVKARTRDLEGKTAELEALLKRLEDTQLQLVQVEKMAAIGQLSSGITHEIKNPLNYLRQNLSLVREHLNPRPGGAEESKEKASEAREVLKESMEAVERIVEIVSAMGRFYRPDQAGKTEVNLHDLLDSALVLFRHRFMGRVTVHKEYGALRWVDCWPGQLTQVFVNLFSNADHAVGERGDIFVATQQSDGKAVVRIRDSGQGIEPKMAGRIFEPGFTTKKPGEGSGMGLALSREIVRRHNGTIEVESEPGKGATFIVSLSSAR